MKDSECIDCGVLSGAKHEFGCSVERCPFCGGSLSACLCVYFKLGEELGWSYKPPIVKARSRITGLILEPDGIPPDYTDIEIISQDYYLISHKTDGLPACIYHGGLTEAMENRWIEMLEEAGRIEWQGEWPGSEECREYDLWCKRSSRGWVSCDRSDPKAVEDLHRLTELCEWSQEKKRYVLKKN